MTTQTEMPGVPRSALSRYCEDFVDQRKRIDEEKDKLKALGLRIVKELKEAKRTTLTLKIDTMDGIEHYTFSVEESQEKLKVTRK